MNDYLLDVKSTIDKTMNDLVTSLAGQFPNLKGVDVDNLVETDEIMKSEDPVILWQLLTLTPTPRDPLYRLEFLVGAKTVSDHGSYDLTSLNNELRKSFEVDTSIAVGDYSDTVAVLGKGYFVVTDNPMAPQQYDHMAGIRFFSVRAMGARTV